MASKKGQGLGRKLSEEVRKNISIGHLGTNLGSKNNKWKGGISKTENYKKEKSNKI